MKKISNPYTGIDNYNCFGCSPDNSSGLQLEFFKDGTRIYSRWKGGESFEGFPNVLHGGVQAALLDEIGSWAVFVLAETAGITRSLSCRYRRPVYLDKGDLILQARIENRKKNIVTVHASLSRDGEEEVLSDAHIEYFTFPPAIAAKKMHYPGIDAFFSPEAGEEEKNSNSR
jgi:acyl-coenzyme A thioesterase PaaI-like protein